MPYGSLDVTWTQLRTQVFGQQTAASAEHPHAIKESQVQQADAPVPRSSCQKLEIVEETTTARHTAALKSLEDSRGRATGGCELDMKRKDETLQTVDSANGGKVVDMHAKGDIKFGTLADGFRELALALTHSALDRYVAQQDEIGEPEEETKATITTPTRTAKSRKESVEEETADEVERKSLPLNREAPAAKPGSASVEEKGSDQQTKPGPASVEKKGTHFHV